MNTSQVVIRRLEANDFNKGFLETLESLSPVGIMSKNKFIAIFDTIKGRPFDPIYHSADYNPNHQIWVAELDGKVVGSATLFIEQKFIHEGGLVGHVEDVVVHKQHQKKGIGTLLMRQLIQEAKRRDCYKIILNCHDHNIPVYGKMGFMPYEKCMRLDLK